ncbi:CAP domain-containing protein [Deinococcus depolymerans]|uniref:CAP domain-containing protein n=1 Tax=Deinococcus depolymerans TaxID=392408 RepID=A0ABP3M2E0_9DEIO
MKLKIHSSLVAALTLLSAGLFLPPGVQAQATVPLPSAPAGTPPAPATGSGVTLPGGAVLSPDLLVASADVFAQLVQADFLSCGQDARRDEQLDLIAGRVLRGFTLKAELGSARYPAKRFASFVLPRLGRANQVAGALANQCAHRVGFSRYGVAVQDGRATLVYVQPAQIEASDPHGWMLRFMAITNEARRQGQRCGDQLFGTTGPLRWDDRLASSAQMHVNDMIRLNFRGHVNPETGSEPPDRARASGYTGAAVGENAAYNVLTPEEALQALLDSPGHCRTLMNPDWTAFGAAMGNGVPGNIFNTYWVQDFGR